MRITFDEQGWIGYIYLLPGQVLAMEGVASVSEQDKEKVRKLGALSTDYVSRLQHAERTYNEALDLYELQEWYMNDKDEQGYMTGIELDMSPEGFQHLTANVAVASLDWQDKHYDVLLLDELERAFSPENVLYAMNDARDVYVVLRMDGTAHFDVTAVVSARPDLYPTEYWLHPIYCVFPDETKDNE